MNKKPIKRASPFYGLYMATIRCDDDISVKIQDALNPGSIQQKKNLFQAIEDEKIKNNINPILHCGCTGQLLIQNSGEPVSINRTDQNSEDKSAANVFN